MPTHGEGHDSREQAVGETGLGRAGGRAQTIDALGGAVAVARDEGIILRMLIS